MLLKHVPSHELRVALGKGDCTDDLGLSLSADSLDFPAGGLNLDLDVGLSANEYVCCASGAVDCLEILVGWDARTSSVGGDVCRGVNGAFVGTTADEVVEGDRGISKVCVLLYVRGAE